MHNCGIRTSNLVHTFHSHYHYAASVDTLVLQMSVTRFIFNRPCSPRAHSRHLTAGVGHTVRDQPQRPRRPWLGHRRPGPPLGSPSPGVPVTGTLAPTGRQFWSGRSQYRLTEARLRNICRLLLAGWPVEVQWTHSLSTKGVTPGRPLGRGRQLDLS